MIQTIMKKVSLVISLRLSVTQTEKIHRLRETKIIASFIFIWFGQEDNITGSDRNGPHSPFRTVDKIRGVVGVDHW